MSVSVFCAGGVLDRGLAVKLWRERASRRFQPVHQWGRWRRGPRAHARVDRSGECSQRAGEPVPVSSHLIAGAEGIVNYRTEDAVAAVRRLTPSGVDLIVEVAPDANAELDSAVLARDGTVALYARGSDETLTLPLHALMPNNTRYEFVLVYTMTAEVKQHAVDDVSSAVAAGALGVGEAAGLPLQHFPLSRTAEAHEAAEAGITGKVLIDLGDTAPA